LTGSTGPRRLLFVSAWTALSLIANGYVFGVADHGIHLPFLHMVRAPEAWQGDLLLDAFAHHHSFLWHLQAPFAALLGLPAWTAALHVAALFGTGLMVHLLAETLSDSPRAPALALVLVALAHPALGGADTLDPLLLNRGVALPIELGALWLLLRGRRGWSFALLGLAAWIHVPSAAALAVGAGLVSLTGWSEQGAKERAAPLLFGVAALPVLIRWVLAGDVPEGLWRVDAAWRSILEARLGHHLAPQTWPLWDWLTAASWLALGAAALWRSRLDARVAWLVGGLVAWSLLAGLVGGSLLGVGLGLQLEPWQAWRFVVLLCALLGGCWLARSGGISWLIVLLYAAGRGPWALPLLALTLVLEHRAETPGRFRALAAAALVVLAVLAGGRFPADGTERARLLPAGEPGEEARVADWLRDHTAPGTLVAVPPHRFESERWRALRPFFVTWKDGGEALFDRDLALEWRRRLELACACRPLDGPPGPGTPLARLRERIEAGVLAADPARLADLLETEGVDVLIVDRPVDRPLLHRTETWRIYQLSPPR